MKQFREAIFSVGAPQLPRLTVKKRLQEEVFSVGSIMPSETTQISGVEKLDTQTPYVAPQRK
jgi:hypothetical protein